MALPGLFKRAISSLSERARSSKERPPDRDDREDERETVVHRAREREHLLTDLVNAKEVMLDEMRRHIGIMTTEQARSEASLAVARVRIADLEAKLRDQESVLEDAHQQNAALNERLADALGRVALLEGHAEEEENEQNYAHGEEGSAEGHRHHHGEQVHLHHRNCSRARRRPHSEPIALPSRADSSTQNGAGSSEESRCVIDFEPFRVGDSLMRLPCFHVHHVECLLPYLKDQEDPECPICRTPVPPEDIDHLPVWVMQ